MNVTLEAIKFNHDPTSKTTGAFNIRRNETRIVSVPEWRRDNCSHPECSPVAYAISTVPFPVTIQASFACDDIDATHIRIRALDGHNGAEPNTLGDIPEHDFQFNAGFASYQTLRLPNATIASGGVNVSDVVWRWQFLQRSNWIDIETTSHRVYVVLAPPSEPWHPKANDPLDTQLPWTEVLEFACSWAAGGTTADQVASCLTHRFNELGTTAHTSGTSIFKYDGPGSSHYNFPNTINFDCTHLLERLKGGLGNGEFLNCSDCAVVVGSFANILGCSLWQSLMGYNFATNTILKIGLSVPDTDEFLYHEAVWKDSCTKDDPLFDPCLKVDEALGPPFNPLLPLNIKLGDPDDNEYHSLLAANNTRGARCEARPGTRVRRIIGKFGLRRPTLDPVLLKMLAEIYDFEAWEGLRRFEEYLFIWRFFFSGHELPGWQLDRIDNLEAKDGLRQTQSFWRRVDSKVRIRVDAFQSISLVDAHALVLRVLGGFQRRDITRLDSYRVEDQEMAVIGDVAFMSSDESAVLFARANLVFLIRSVGSEPSRVARSAYQFDVHLRRKPEEVLNKMKRFELAKSKCIVNEKVPLILLSPEPLHEESIYRFFSSAEISLEDNRPVCCPKTPGVHELRIFALDPAHNIREQNLSLTAL